MRLFTKHNITCYQLHHTASNRASWIRTNEYSSQSAVSYRLAIALFVTLFYLLQSDTPTAKARWVLMYIHFPIYSKAYKTNDFP